MTVLQGPPRLGELYTRVRSVALTTPQSVAVIGHDGSTTTYGRLLELTDTAAERLSDRLEPGDVLGLAASDPVAFVSVYLAAARLNTVTVLLDSRLPGPELARDMAKFDVTWLADDAAPAQFPGDFALRTPDGPAPRRALDEHDYRPDDFVVHCTSGSTGEPKGIVMSQAAIAARTEHWAVDTELTSSDTVLCILPLAHCHGIDVLTLPALVNGATVLFAPGSRLTARALAKLIARHRPTIMSALPVTYQMLTAAGAVRPDALASLRLVISGSAPLPVDTQERFLERFGVPLRQVYGLSEIAVICFDRSYVAGGSIGLPVTGVEWRLEPVAAGAGDEPLSELYVRGPALARGYYRDAAATARMFEDGWLRTRDIVLARPDGWYVRGRQSNFINVAGNKVGPLEVEAALRNCSGIVDAAVVGMHDNVTGEHVAALVVTDPGAGLGTVRARLGERLPSYQLPQRYALADALPRTPLGKTDYAAVKRLLGATEGKTHI